MSNPKNLLRLIALLERDGSPSFFPTEENFASFLNPLQEQKFNDRTEYQLSVGPSFKKEDLSLTLEDGKLTVTGQSSEESENGISHASLNCTWGVSENVTEDDISANFKDGTLTITVKGQNPEVKKPGIKIN